MAVVQLLSLCFLFVAVCAAYEKAPVCDDLSVIVNYDTPDSDYTMSMTADDSYGTCASFDQDKLKKALLGSDQMWRSTCKKPVAHTLEIEPTVECRGDDWTVQFITFKLKGAKKVEVFVDDEKIFSKMVGLYFTFSQVINQPGKTVKIVAYPKWRFTCIVFFDVQVNYCCVPLTTTTTTTTPPPPTTTPEPERECKEICIQIPIEELTADDGAVCSFPIGTEPCGKWACNGTCFDEDSPGITEVGAVHIGTELGGIDGIARQCECCSAVDGFFEEFAVDCILDTPGGDIASQRTAFIYRINFCECQPCNGGPEPTTTPEPYGNGDRYPPMPEYGGYGVPPKHGYPWPPMFPPFWWWKWYGGHGGGLPYEGEEYPYGGGGNPPYGGLSPPHGQPHPGQWY